MRIDIKIDMRYSDWLDTELKRIVAEAARQERVMDKALEIERDPNQIDRAIVVMADSEHADAFYRGLSVLMQHGGDADDARFLEAARGVHDALSEICYAAAEVK